MLYFLLTGRPPFIAETPLDILVQLFDREALRPRSFNKRIPPDLDRICLRCLEKNPERRYPSAAALADDLEAFLRGEPVHMPLADTQSRLRHWVRTKPALAARLLTLGACGLISTIGFAVSSGISAHHQLKVMTTVFLWAVVCALCQAAMSREKLVRSARIAWVVADPFFLTVIMRIDRALETPLVALYPALIVASGLWFDVRLVRLTTQLCSLGYICLAGLELYDHGRLLHPHWHIIVLAGLAATGLIVSYHVHRVSVLGRVCEVRTW